MQFQLAVGNLVSSSAGFVGDIISGNNRAYNLTTLGVNIVENFLTDGGLMAAKAGFIASKVGIFGTKTVTALKASSVGKSVALGGMFGRTVELPKSQAMRQRILVNIAESKIAREKSLFEIHATIEEVLKINVSSELDSAVFWSGPGNRSLAEQFASINNKVTLESTFGGKYLDSMKLFEKYNYSQAIKPWEILSARYAEAAKGYAYAFIEGASESGIYNRIELPNLVANKNIVGVIPLNEQSLFNKFKY